MSTIQELFQQAQLAEAAYANFWDSNLNVLITNPDDVQKALIDSGFSSDPSDPTKSAQAGEFVAHWKVVDQFTASSVLGATGSGFSATVFESVDNPSQYVVSVRGSEKTLSDWANTNFGDIGADGIAMQESGRTTPSD